MSIEKIILTFTVVALCLALSWLADTFMKDKHAE